MPEPSDPSPPTPHSLFGAVRATALVTLASRIGGLARDVLLGRIFGDSAINSAFAAGFAIPNMFRRLFGEGALTAAFIPEYAHASREDPHEADRFASRVVSRLAIGSGLLTAALEFVLLAALLVLPHDADRRLSIALIMTMLPFMPLICVTAILGGMLQVHGRFAAAASGPLLLNGFIIAVGAWHVAAGRLGDERIAFVLGGATVLSGLTQAAWFARLLRRNARWTRNPPDPQRLRRAARAFAPALIGLGTLQLGAFLDTLIAMWPIWVGPTIAGRTLPLDESSNGILALTQRLYQFPLGVFGIAVASSAFAILSRARDDRPEFLRTLRRAARLSMFLGLPASVGLVIVRGDLTAVLFGGTAHGFSGEGLARSAAVLLGYAPAIWAFSLNHTLTRAFYALGDTTTPMRVSLAIAALCLALNLVLIWPLREAGLAWATSASAVTQCGLLWRMLARRLGPIADPELTRSFLRLALAAAIMGAALVGAGSFRGEPGAWPTRLAWLVGQCGAGFIVYAGACAVLRVPEAAWLLRARRADSRHG